ncbi:hypothetical protein CBR_g3540 [Chara braunii]|uniref:Saposin B-type domain-containing protein n=1 Tax=Chara braunii TaxID=69332 RepID=A0A388KFQ3_CHABU|nr:hypothetical protein CBR_g3540 [Chara braunii]|eukprot:GBG68846.1 hypothetical protein CBR_g3540 [Chara braunii]
MVGFRSRVLWAVTGLLLLSSVATWLVAVNGRQLAGGDDGIEMVTSQKYSFSSSFSSSSSDDDDNDVVVWKEEGSTAAAAAAAAALPDVHPFCKFCKGAVKDFQAEINRPDAVDVAVQSFEQFVCGKLQAEGIREKCKEVGEIYIPALIDVLREDVTEDKVCGALKLCDEDDGLSLSSPRSPLFSPMNHPPPHRPRHRHSKRRCKVCEAFAAQALRYLGQNETVAEIVSLAHKACQRLKGETSQEECNSLVEVYAQDLPSVMASITPEQFCHLLKFCDGDDNPAAAAADDERERDDGEAEDVNDVNAVGHGGNECLLCRYAVVKARKRLENPEVQEMILGLLDRTCEKVPKHTDQCKAFLESYSENFFANLDVILDPHGFCRRMGACFSSSM